MLSEWRLSSLKKIPYKLANANYKGDVMSEVLSKEKQKFMILNENMWKVMWRVSWPSIIAMVLYGLNSVFDAIFVGSFVGETALAGVSIAYSAVANDIGHRFTNRCWRRQRAVYRTRCGRQVDAAPNTGQCELPVLDHQHCVWYSRLYLF